MSSFETTCYHGADLSYESENSIYSYTVSGGAAVNVQDKVGQDKIVSQKFIILFLNYYRKIL